MEASLEMFFDEQFDPASFVDALYSLVLANQAPYLDTGLHQLQSKSNGLISHLDYYTGELSKQLSTKVAALRDSELIILQVEGDDITRLEYYLKSMDNAISSLQAELEAEVRTSTQSETIKTDDSDPIDLLVKLKIVGERMQQTLDIFGRLDPITKDMSGPITLEMFNNKLESLVEKLVQEIQVANSSNIETKEALAKEIDLFVGILPLFQGTSFHALFKKCATRLNSEKEKLMK